MEEGDIEETGIQALKKRKKSPILPLKLLTFLEFSFKKCMKPLKKGGEKV